MVEMAKKRPAKKKAAAGSGQKKRKKKKMRLTLKSRSLKQTDSYSDAVGWSVSGRVLEDPSAGATEESSKIKHQCTLCGSVMMVGKPKRAKYTITCPHCEHVDDFSS